MKTLVMFGVVALALAGCGAAEDEGVADESNLTEGGEADRRGNLTANVTRREVEHLADDCSLRLIFPVVDVNGDAKVNAAIAKELPIKDAGATCAAQKLATGERVQMHHGFTVHTNEASVLSMSMVMQSSRHPVPDFVTEVVAKTFDLRTGELLSLSDVLTPAGIATARTECIRKIAAVLDQARATVLCERGTKDATTGFTVLKGEGLALVFDGKGVDIPLGTDATEAIVPWEALEQDLKPGIVANVVKSSR